MNNNIEKDSVARFSDRVVDYIRYRPSYPVEALDAIRAIGGLSAGAEVADLGAGTGIWTRILLDAGFQVTAMEPNLEMRRAAEESLGNQPGFRSLEGASDRTGLPPASVDLVTAAQAFHWFDVAKTRRECLRVLKQNAWVVLLFNERLVDGSPFLIAYESLLQRYATDYNLINHANLNVDPFPMLNNSITKALRGVFYRLRTPLRKDILIMSPCLLNLGSSSSDVKRMDL
jgi:SAM-dependent methyltransferase